MSVTLTVYGQIKLGTWDVGVAQLGLQQLLRTCTSGGCRPKDLLIMLPKQNTGYDAGCTCTVALGEYKPWTKHGRSMDNWLLV